MTRLGTIWKSKQLSLGTEIKLYNSNAKSVLLYASECRRRVKMGKLDAFRNITAALGRSVTSTGAIPSQMYKKTRSKNTSQEILRLRWLGHVLGIHKGALCWTPPGKRK